FVSPWPRSGRIGEMLQVLRSPRVDLPPRVSPGGYLICRADRDSVATRLCCYARRVHSIALPLLRGCHWTTLPPLRRCHWTGLPLPHRCHWTSLLLLHRCHWRRPHLLDAAGARRRRMAEWN